MRFKAVLFDMDGTLLDTLEDIADSMNEVLRQHGFATHDLEAYKYYVGNGMDVLVRRALPAAHRNQEMIAACLARMRQEYTNRWRNNTTVYEGISGLLDGMQETGIKLAILSNKADDFTREMAAELLSRWSFDQLLGARPNIAKKPDPAAALEIAENLQLSPRDFLYLGDTSVDMTTACQAGMYPVGVLWGFRGAEELLDSGARMLITHPSDLLSWL